MNTTAINSTEQHRLAALYRTGLLTEDRVDSFDRITALAAQCLDMPVGLFSLVDQDQQYFKARYGFTLKGTPRAISFCTHTLAHDQLLVINDAEIDARFSNNPLVTQAPYIRFYAGTPVRTECGAAIGSLCVIDHQPRRLSSRQGQLLQAFARLIENVIAADTMPPHPALQPGLKYATSLLNALPDPVFVVDAEGSFCRYAQLFEVYKTYGSSLRDLIPQESFKICMRALQQAFAENEQQVFSFSTQVMGQSSSFEARICPIDNQEALVILRNITELNQLQSELHTLSEVARQTTNGVIICDRGGKVSWVNESFSRLSGYSLEQIQGEKPGSLLQGPLSDPTTIKIMSDALRDRQPFEVDIVNYTCSGQPYWMRISCNPLRDAQGQHQGFIAIQSDITQEKETNERIHNHENLLASVIDANRLGTWRLDLQDQTLSVNQQWAELLGYRLEELEPISFATWEQLTHPDDVAYCLSLLKRHMKNPRIPYYAKIRMRHKQGHWFWISSRGKVIEGQQLMLGTHVDINEQVKAEQVLREQSLHMQVIVDNMIDGIITLDDQYRVISANPAALNIFGYPDSRMVGADLRLLIPDANTPQSKEKIYDNLYAKLHSPHNLTRLLNLVGRHANNEHIPLEASVSMAQQQGRDIFILMVRDISERQAAEAEIKWLAFYDPLTTLPNRRLLTDILNKTLASCHRHHHHSALLFVDLDNFKLLNDTAGHNTGDQLLQEVAKRLQQQVREDDTVARLGGDEFIIIIDNLDQNEQMAATQASKVAEKIRLALNQFYRLHETEFRTSPSIGVTLFGPNKVSAEDVLKQADMAMYQAKSAGRNSVRFFDPKMQEALNHKSAMERDLSHAQEGGELKLHLQKQVDRKGETVGAEALIRWQHPDKGLISPADFIPLAEETGMIIAIGEWVLEQACRYLESWSQDPERQHWSLSVNISVVQFYQADFVERVTQLLARTPGVAERLKLEVTESVVAHDIDHVIARMNELRTLGVSFALDDFGTGYSSLSYLKKLPLDQLKIDQGFIKNILHSRHDQAIAETIITLAKKLGLDVVAEGVETESQHQLLDSLGCTCYQGYLFGKPAEYPLNKPPQHKMAN